MRSGSGAQCLWVNPAIPHKFASLSARPRDFTIAKLYFSKPRLRGIHPLPKRDQRNSRANHHNSSPTRHRNIFTQNVFRAERSHYIAQR